MKTRKPGITTWILLGLILGVITGLVMPEWLYTPENMILVKEDLHDEITAAHSKFYDWRKS